MFVLLLSGFGEYVCGVTEPDESSLIMDGVDLQSMLSDNTDSDQLSSNVTEIGTGTWTLAGTALVGDMEPIFNYLS